MDTEAELAEARAAVLAASDADLDAALTRWTRADARHVAATILEPCS